MTALTRYARSAGFAFVLAVVQSALMAVPVLAQVPTATATNSGGGLSGSWMLAVLIVVVVLVIVAMFAMALSRRHADI